MERLFAVVIAVLVLGLPGESVETGDEIKSCSRSSRPNVTEYYVLKC